MYFLGEHTLEGKPFACFQIAPEMYKTRYWAGSYYFQVKKKKICLENMLAQNFHSKNKLILISSIAHMSEQAFSLSAGNRMRHVCLCCYRWAHRVVWVILNLWPQFTEIMFMWFQYAKKPKWWTVCRYTWITNIIAWDDSGGWNKYIFI